MYEDVYNPPWYTESKEAIQVIEAAIDGLGAIDAYNLGQVLKYCLRAGKKENAVEDLLKANNYAFRLTTGKWKWEHEQEA